MELRDTRCIDDPRSGRRGLPGARAEVPDRHSLKMRLPSFVPAAASRVLAVALSLVVASLILADPTEARIRTPFTPTSTIELSPGISYTKGTMRTGWRNFIQSVRVVTVTPTHPSVRLRSLLSNDLVVGRERATQLAQRLSAPGMVAMVATNGDMSTRGRVDAYAAPQSMAVSGGELLVAQACTRPTLGIDRAGEARIDDVRVHVTMGLAPPSQSMPGRPGRQVRMQVHRVNTHRDDQRVVLFTSRFAASTQTAPGGVEVVLSLPGVLRPNGVQDVQVLEVRPGAGDTPLGPGMAVLSVQGPTNPWVGRLQPGQWMRLKTRVVHRVDKRCGGTIEDAPGWGHTVEAVGGNHFTLRNGALAAPSSEVYPGVGKPRSPHQRGRHGRRSRPDGHRGWSPAGLQRRGEAGRDGRAHAFAGRRQRHQPRWRRLDADGQAFPHHGALQRSPTDRPTGVSARPPRSWPPSSTRRGPERPRIPLA